MKKRASIYGIFTLAALFFFISCGQRTGSTDVSEDLAEIREDTREVITKIDEALAMNEVSDFRSQVEDALDQLDSQIEDYHSTMDNANMRIESDTRDAVINLEQKRAAIEFKLELLENGDGMDTDYRTSPGTRTDDRTSTDMTQTDRTGTDRTGTDRTGTDRTRTDRTDLEDQTGTEWTDEQTGRQQTQDPRSTELEETSTDERIRTDRDTRTITDRDEDVNYAPELMDELRTDLMDLKIDIEEFINKAL